MGYSRAVRVDDRIFVSGTTALNHRGEVDGPGDLRKQTQATLATIAWAIEKAGGTLADLVYTKTFVTDISEAKVGTRARLDALGDVRPTATLLGVPALIRPEILVEIEAEAIVGASSARQDTAMKEHMPRKKARAIFSTKIELARR